MPERSSIWLLPAISTICICLVALFSADGECHHTVSIVMTLDEAKFGRMPEAERLEAAKAIAERHNMTVKRLFLTNRFFIEHSGDVDDSHGRRKRRSVALEELQKADGVTSIVEEPLQPILKHNQSQSKGQAFFAQQQQAMEPQQKEQMSQQYYRKIPHLPFPDPLYPKQWNLGGGMKVRKAWLMGYSGHGVTVSVIDDGIQHDHPDLKQNYDPQASTDIFDHDDDPMPPSSFPSHGTQCAGVIGAQAGNNVCGVGIAFRAKIGGIRTNMIGDAVYAASLSFRPNHIDIYSCSWGPQDNGGMATQLGPLTQLAFQRGAEQGRRGLGNIFVFAGGNGGLVGDHCSMDSFVGSIYTLGINSVTDLNGPPFYGEECSAIIASTYSNGGGREIVSTDVGNSCVTDFGRTSASAPEASAIIALALEANPRLTWRDVQHLVVRTSRPKRLLASEKWAKNGVGRLYNPKFGFGLMNAARMVRMAEKWKTVSKQLKCIFNLTLPRPQKLSSKKTLEFALNVTDCKDINHLEHVQALVSIKKTLRGALRLILISPMGTAAELLAPRRLDFNRFGFAKWPFLAMQMWGEKPHGTWTLHTSAFGSRRPGTLYNVSLVLYGTKHPAQPSGKRQHH